MGIVSKKAKIILYLILFLETGFLIRAFVIYSFYKNDETYGDGVSNPSKYNHDFYSTILISLVLPSLLLLGSILFLKRNKGEK